MINRFLVSRDDSIYQAWPDLTLTRSGRLVCVFSECTHHFDRSYTRIVYVISDDSGRTWSKKKPLSAPLHKKQISDPNWNCARISALQDGRLVVIVDRMAGEKEGAGVSGEQSNWLWYSMDEGDSWTGPHETPVYGIVPDQIIEITKGKYAGRWLTTAHQARFYKGQQTWKQQCWYTDDQGKLWEGPFLVASDSKLQLCEGSILPLPTGELVCFMRENSGQGLDASKVISRDGGRTWEGLTPFPLPGCHRPVAGLLQSGKVLISYRFLQGGGPHGWGTQNFFAALTDVESCLAPNRAQAHARLMPLDFDRSPRADLGYSGWVQFPNGEIYIVNYIVDDAPKAQIRGYALKESDFGINPGAEETEDKRISSSQVLTPNNMSSSPRKQIEVTTP
jgi:hypothetical protein